MPTYIILGNFTDQGIRNIRESPKRENAFRNLCEKAGAQVKDTYRTMGRYDLAACLPRQLALIERVTGMPLAAARSAA